MSNFLVSYDLNGPLPKHQDVDQFIRRIAPKSLRILETVWWVRYNGTSDTLRNAMLNILSPNDRLFVAETGRVNWQRLLVPDIQFKSAYES